MVQAEAKRSERDGFLTRLRRDKRGNVIVIGAAALIPLAGMVGGGLDIGRMYITKTRLQHACDAGALAGRKAMGAGSWSRDDHEARDVANQFFRGNWETGAYGSFDLSRTYTESNGVVNGAVSVKLPMTLMRIFGKTVETITVACDAEMRLLNTDVMFVLDTTGSMNEIPSGDSARKIDSLKVAVKCFYQILAQLDIADQDCEGDEPSGGIASDVQLRFGFVPYSVNVNVGRLLPPSYFPDSWSYNTREYANSSAWSDWYTDLFWPTNNTCPVAPNTGIKQFRYTQMINISGTNICYRERRNFAPVFKYYKKSINLVPLKNGSGWNAGFTSTKTGVHADTHAVIDETITWAGCVEERSTVSASGYDPRPSGALDLDIDSVPIAGNSNTQWKPSLPQLTYLRGYIPYESNANTAEVTNSSWYESAASGYACPTTSRKLRSYQTSGGPADFSSYVTSLSPAGNTYHDIGMIWGQRLLSPTGLFASENAQTSSGGAIERHLIFMTDGDTMTGVLNYNAYGVPFYDRRQTDPNVVPADDQNAGYESNQNNTNTQVNKRFEALCEHGKGRFTIWTIGFGNLSADTETRLKNCASPGRSFKATSGPEIQQVFRNIAEQIGQLRLRQ